jgi:geranylgeranyl pyrophosphate synthase
VNNENYCVKRFVLQLCITLHYRIYDIQDDSSLRRGIPTAHTVYGVASTTIAAICVIFILLQRLLRFNYSVMIKLYTEMMSESW